MYRSIYALPISVTVWILVLFSLGWSFAAAYRKRIPRRGWKGFCLIFFVLWVCLVLHLTLFSRSPGDCGVHLRPFDQILTVFAGGSRELLRTFWMNVLLFAPCGFFFPELLPDGWRGRTRCAVNAAFAFLLSLTIELLQWRWCLGEAETDDVLANTFGAFLSFALIRLFGKINWRELCAALYGFFRNLRKPPQD